MVSFKIPGFEVDLMGSGPHQVTLLNVAKHISGEIKCEVSAEGTFSTGWDSAILNVVDMGIRRPIIIIPDENQENIDFPVNCSAQVTDPPPRITFYIENEKVNGELVTNVRSGFASLSSSAITSIMERFPLHTRSSTPLWIRCEATLRGVYNLSSQTVPIYVNILKSRSNAVDSSNLVIFISIYFIQYYLVLFIDSLIN
ncbi:hypothetical protein O3M35_002400 [Rhynocoris fuscipes]|uniref:Uncharacterized protein n=1 Tax=Rhynocoris fuscipes TaxID=488301 RepID=A0AAW1CP95_9HEMI